MDISVSACKPCVHAIAYNVRAVRLGYRRSHEGDMAPAAKNDRYEVRGVERLEAFSDGVFAIAITLLILEIKVPSLEATSASGLWRALVSHWSSYLAFALSFLIIGIMWANHHNIFRYVRGADHALAMFNLGLLFCVAFLPFPTAVL